MAHAMMEWSERLQSRRLSAAAAAAKAPLFERAAGALREAGVTLDAEARAWFVPGRVEVLGKHTDYCGGRSLVMAVERGFCVIAAPRADRLIRLFDVATGRTAEFALDPALQPVVGEWTNYPMTVARRLARNFPPVKGHAGAQRGATIAFLSDLPLAAGLSSSSAFVVALALALARLNDLDAHPAWRKNLTTPEALAGYLGTVENGQSFGTLRGDRGVGTFGGSEDHTAILCAQPGQLSLYSYCPVRFERVLPVPANHVFAVLNSGVVAEKTGAALEKYNRVSALAAEIVRLWQRAGHRESTLAAILERTGDEVGELTTILSQGRRTHTPFGIDELGPRFDHFQFESNIDIPGAADALAAGELGTFGELVQISQENGAKLLQNQVPETVALARLARELGAVASSAFGAGFGGSVWALVAEEGAPQFLAQWRERYLEAFPEHAAQAEGFLTLAGPAAFELTPPADD